MLGTLEAGRRLAVPEQEAPRTATDSPDWPAHFDREEGRYRDGEARLPDADDPDARQRQLTRLGNAAAGAGLALLMQGRREDAREWFARAAEATTALWWVPAGHVPSLEEAKERLAHLAQHGPTPFAFTFKVRFPPPDEDPELIVVDDELGCPA
jgi:hypothetical protein